MEDPLSVRKPYKGVGEGAMGPIPAAIANAVFAAAGIRLRQVPFTPEKVKEAMTFSRRGFPVYCAHCFFQNISPLEEGGEPLFITEPAREIGEEPCRIIVYKKRLRNDE
jgi:hypothetical protein